MKKPAGLFFKIISVAGIAAISACGGIYTNYDSEKHIDPLDRPAKLERDDFTKNLFPKTKDPAEAVQLKEPALPKVSEVLSAPRPPKIGSDKLITISVTDDIQLKDVFLELSRLANIDIEVESNIRGGVIFKATDKPVGEVIERITDLAGLRYSIKNGVLRIMNDSPYVENYQANFLNIIRKNTAQIGANTKLTASGGAGGSGGGNNGSESAITQTSGGDGDIWAALEKEIGSIIGVSTGAGGAAAATTGAAPAFISLNREAGVISVKTTFKNHQKIQQYLDQVKEYYSSQVLIEAKVVEVSLNDEFRSGIDWTLISQKANGRGISIDTTGIIGAATPGFSAGGNLAKLDFASGDITTAVNLAEIFGTTRTLSSPRILAMNNQQAILSFAKNESYFALNCTQTDPVITNGNITTPGKLTVTSQLNTVPIGVILSLKSSIDTRNNEIVMNIRPTLSRLTGKTTEDPATTLCIANAKAASSNPASIPNVTSIIPQVDVREMDSVLRLKNGEIMVIGGMIDQKSNNTDTGLPWVSEIPVFGNAFKTVDKQNETVQTVIFLKATIVPGYGVDAHDQKFYNTFETDPRPEKF